MDKSKVQEKLFGDSYSFNYNRNNNSSSFDAHGCTLKLLCEVARTPSSQDLLGEALQLLLAPRELLMEAAEEEGGGGGGCLASNVYLRAQASGAIRGDCSGYEPLCGVGLTEVSCL